MGDTDWNVRARQQHSLDRDEAKSKVSEKIDQFLANHGSWGITGAWENNYTYTFSCSAGMAAGARGEIKVWSEQVVLNLALPENLVPYSTAIEDTAEKKLANILE